MTHVLDQPYDSQNVFAAILAGSAPAHRIFENDMVLAVLDIAPHCTDLLVRHDRSNDAA